MKQIFKTSFLAFFFLAFTGITGSAFEPANKNMSPEAKALLELHYSISGKYILTGQHNYPVTKDRNTRFAKSLYGKTPAVWSSDFGFSAEGDKDCYLARPDIVKEAIRQHKKGSIITLCWHAVPPTANEPITFQPRGKVEPGKLASVQGRLLEEQYKELLTPRTPLYKQWASQVDTIAYWLKQLQEAKVPVLWRPYHEMNGSWFWWGERVGPYSTIDIYRQLFDRMVHYHKLNNLIWVWNVDRPSTPIRKFSNFYPGNNYLDIVSLDVYGSDFNQAYYDSLVALSNGKPLLFGEVGQPPLVPVIDKQPLWTSWVIWAGMAKDMSDEHLAMLKDPRVLSQDDPTFWEILNPYRKTCALPLLPLNDEFTSLELEGTWILDPAKNDKRSRAPFLLVIDRDKEVLFVKQYQTEEYGEDKISFIDLLLDGGEIVYKNPGFIEKTKSTWNGKNKAVEVQTLSIRQMGNTAIETKKSEQWKCSSDGKTLIITLSAPDRSGEKKTSVNTYIKLIKN